MTEHYGRQREYCPACAFMRLTVDASGLCRSCRRGTKRRVYVSGGWFASDDPRREVKPQYLDYITTVATPSEGKAE